MKILRKIKNNKMLSNISWIIGGRIIYMILNFAVNILSARYLGPSNYGLLGYAAAYTTFFASLCNLGIDSIIIKELIEHKDKEGTIIGTSIGLKLISSFLSLIIITNLTLIIDRNEHITELVVILYALHMIFNAFSLIKFWFQARLQSKNNEIAVTIAYFIMAIYKVYLLITNKSIIWFSLSNTIELIIVGIILYYMYKKNNGGKLLFSFNDSKRILKNSYPFIISGFMVALYNSTDRFMIKQMLDSAEVSYYQAAISISNLSTFLLTAIIESMTPIIIEEYKRDINQYNKKNKQLYAAIFYISTIVSIITVFFSKFIIHILYGELYMNSVMPLNILTWYTVFSYLGVARNTWVVCENKQSKLKNIYICCATCNIVLNYIFIPYYGASGAAIASLVTQIGTIFIFPLFIKDLRENVKLMIDAIFLKGIK